MAITYISGFEAGLFTTNGGGLFNYALAPYPTIQSDVVRTGDYALHVASSAAQYVRTNIGVATLVMGFAINIHSIATTQTQYGIPLSRMSADQGAGAVLVYDPVNHKLGNGFVTALPAQSLQVGGFNLDQWYWIDMKLDVSANPRLLQWRIDGIDQPSASYAATPGKTTGGSLGYDKISNTSVDVYYDDWVIADSAADYPIGDTHIKAYRVTSTGSNNNEFNFTSSVGPIDSNSYQLVDDKPVSNTPVDYIKQSTADSQGYLEFNLENLGPNDSAVAAIRGIIGVHATSPGPLGVTWPLSHVVDSGTVKLINGVNSYTIYSGNMVYGGSTTTSYIGTMLPVPAGPATTDFNGFTIRAGYGTALDFGPSVDLLMLEIALRQGLTHSIDAYLSSGTNRTHSVDSWLSTKYRLTQEIFATLIASAGISTQVDALIQGVRKVVDVDSLIYLAFVGASSQVDAYLDTSRRVVDFSIDANLNDTMSDWQPNELL